MLRPPQDVGARSRIFGAVAPGDAAWLGPSPTVSVVIPTYNRRERLPRVLAPLLCDEHAAEIVVVVDGSTDGSMELLDDLAKSHPRLRPVFTENRGEMGARALGAELARGDVLLMLDDDVIAGPGLAAGHARQHAQGRQKMIVLGYMPTVIPPGRFASDLYAGEYERMCVAYERDPGTMLTNFWAGNFSIGRRDCLEVGLASPRFTARYHPDRELGLRCLKAGLSAVFDRSLRADHVHERSLAGFLADARSQGEGTALLHRLHGDVLGPVPHRAFEAGLPWSVRWMVRASRNPSAHGLLTRCLTWVAGSAGRLRIRGVENSMARLLRRIEQQWGCARSR